jgi:hypothetical protein
MSSFKTVLIKSAEIADLTSEETFAVVSGPSEFTQYQVSYNAASPSNLSFSVQVPNESVVIDRNVQIQGGVAFTIKATMTSTNYSATEPVINLGQTDAFGAFPINSLFLTSSSTINNVNVSTNTQDVLPALLRMNAARELYRYNSTTPSLPDQAYGVYSQGVGANNNPLAGFNTNGYDEDMCPRGAWNVNISNIVHTYTEGGNTETNTSLFWNSAADAGTNQSWVIECSGFFTEPLLCLSPFTYSNPEYNAQGLLGIQNMSFVFNLDTNCKRFWNTANAITPTNTSTLYTPSWISGVTLGNSSYPMAWINPQLLFNFLSLQPSDEVSTKNVSPYYELPRYITTGQPTLDGADFTSDTGLSNFLNSGRQLVSTTIQLNSIPDLFFIQARVPMSQQNQANTNSFLTISNIVISFNNKSGILSSATQADLWRISRKWGSQQNFNEFQGYAQINNNATGTGGIVATTGSLFVVSPTDFGLPDYLAPSSIGNFNFSVTLTVRNQLPYAVTPEIVVICKNDGLLVSNAGVSSTYLGILTKEMVLSSKAEKAVDPITTVEYERLCGGKFLNRIKSVAHKMRKHHKKHHESYERREEHREHKKHHKNPLSSLLR